MAIVLGQTAFNPTPYIEQVPLMADIRKELMAYLRSDECFIDYLEMAVDSIKVAAMEYHEYSVEIEVPNTVDTRITNALTQRGYVVKPVKPLFGSSGTKAKLKVMW